MRMIRRRLRSLRFQTRLIMSILLVLILCLMVITVWTQYTTRRTLQRNAIENGRVENDTKATMLELNLAQIAKLSTNLYSNADVYSLLRSETLDSTQEYRISLFLRSMMSMSASVNLYQIYLDVYSSGKSFIIGANGNSSAMPSRYHINIPYYIDAGDVYCEGPHLSSTYGSTIGGVGEDVYSFEWKLYDNAQTDVIGTISFDVALSEMTACVFQKNDEMGFLLQDGNVIFSKGITMTNQEARAIFREIVKDGWSEINLDGFRGIAFYSTVELNNVPLQLIRLIPYSELYAEADSLLWRNLICMICGLLICIFCMLYAINGTTRPIRQLDSCLKEIEQEGDLGYRVAEHLDYTAEDELGRLIRQTDNMLDTVEQLFERERLLSKAQRDAEAKMLQAQINPHFLYNSLQSIAALALSHGEKDIFRFITMLGSRMHYSMDLQRSEAPLSAEFEYVENYLTLQNVRFGNTMQANIQLSPEAESIIVPKMILQPLAENAFKHGKLCRLQGNRFNLTGEVENQVLKIVMENTGNPIDQARMDELNRQFAEADVKNYNSGEHIGMLNVLYRLRLFFNEEVSMRISRTESANVHIEIDIPL